MNANNALESRLLPKYWGCYLFVCSIFFINRSTYVFFPLGRLEKKSEPSKEEIRFFVSSYTLPRAQNFKPIFEFQTL